MFLDQAVGLVDEQDAVQRRVNHRIRARPGLADVFSDQRGAVALDQVAFLQNSQRLVNPAHQPGDGRFARARVAGVNGVITGRDRLEPLRNAELLDTGKVGGFLDFLLDGGDADQFVEFLQHLFELFLRNGPRLARRRGVVILANHGDLPEQVLDEAVFLRRQIAVHVGERLTNLPGQKLVVKNQQRRQFELVDDAHHFGERPVQAFLDAIGDRVVEL